MFGAGGRAFLVAARPYVDAIGPGAAIIGVPVMTPYRSVGSYCRRAAGDSPRIAPYAANLHHVDFDVGGPPIAWSARSTWAIAARR